jgi:hypothetical protein
MSLSVQFPTYGTTEVLQIVDAAPLNAGPGRVRLRVHAAGVNPADWKIMGLTRDQIPLNLPAGLGSEAHLFVNLDPASIARLTLSCSSEEEFNSLMSALADVLGQVVAPGTAVPPQWGALEVVRDYLTAALAPDAADRVGAAFQNLIRLRRIRVSTQHGDARHRAVASFTEIGLTFPPPSWDQAWAHIAALAMSALDVLREEVHVGLSP